MTMHTGTADYLRLVFEAGRDTRWISSEQLAEAHARGALLLDIRELEERDSGTLLGAVALTRGLLEIRIHRHCPNKQHPIICFCATGMRSVLAAQTLNALGYSDVRVLRGGLLALDDRHTLLAPSLVLNRSPV